MSPNGSMPTIGLVLACDEHRDLIARHVRDQGFHPQVLDAPRSPVSADCAGWLVSDGTWGAAAKAVSVLRVLKVDAPIVAIVATADDIARARSAGANDCVLLPLDLEEVSIRLRVLLPECHPPASSGHNMLLHDGVVLEASGIRHQGGRIAVRRSEAAMLRYLAANRPRVVPSRELLTHVLRTEGDGGSVRQQVWEIRKKLRAAGLPEMVQTVRGVGYGIAGHTTIRGTDAG